MAPEWTLEAAPVGLIWGLGVDSFQSGTPPRLQRDLGDATAYEAARRNLKARAETLSVGFIRRFPKNLGGTLGRATYPGCRIVLRECRVGSQGRQWCWSRAQLDSTDLLPVLEREFPGVASPDRDSLIHSLLTVP
jgi:hypothetical protein